MKRSFFLAAVVAAFGLSATDAAIAQDTVKIGIIMQMTGVLGPIGKQVTAAAKLYVAQHGTTVAGKRRLQGLTAMTPVTLRDQSQGSAAHGAGSCNILSPA